tara:strand:- start:3870 stop:5159 length:1290 start_codon:yes stop_codon:yes gene_type:complete
MKVPISLTEYFSADLLQAMLSTLIEHELLESEEAFHSNRFLNRSVVPHIKNLSERFNRLSDQKVSDHYWKGSSNPQNLRMAYLLHFMPANLYRMACVWTELNRLGFQWPKQNQLRAVELGAGPGSATSGIAIAESISESKNSSLPEQLKWTWIERDSQMMKLGQTWNQKLFQMKNKPWTIQKNHQKLDLSQPLFDRKTPAFDLWVSSYFLNEIEDTPEDLAQYLIAQWKTHLNKNGIVILIEPALKKESRKFLSFREALLKQVEQERKFSLQVLTPCLGNQKCGALMEPEDWCHEVVRWWRPDYYKKLDQLSGLNRKDLPFSYLVLTRDRRPIEDILPTLSNTSSNKRHRLVSPSYATGRDSEFYLCGQEGKTKAQIRLQKEEVPTRGDILLGTELEGMDHRPRRVLSVDSVLNIEGKHPVQLIPKRNA